MNKKITIGIIILTLLIITISMFWSFSKTKELNIKSAIEKANYCEVDSDCVDAGGKCPFGCYAYVNKDEVEKISPLLLWSLIGLAVIVVIVIIAAVIRKRKSPPADEMKDSDSGKM